MVRFRVMAAMAVIMVVILIDLYGGCLLNDNCSTAPKQVVATPTPTEQPAFSYDPYINATINSTTNWSWANTTTYIYSYNYSWSTYYIINHSIPYPRDWITGEDVVQPTPTPKKLITQNKIIENNSRSITQPKTDNIIEP